VHWLPRMPLTASFPGESAKKPPIKLCALIARFIVAHIVKETKRSPAQADLVGSLYSRDERLFGLVTRLFLATRKKPLEGYNGLVSEALCCV
jgi:hypothetical protein